MAFDFKKEYKDYYLPKPVPQIVTVPKANYIAVRGEGDPNEPGGSYQNAIGILYAIAYTVKMSKKGGCSIPGYYDFVVPPLEGFWRQEGSTGFDRTHKSDFHWISVLRMPEFVTEAVFRWAVEEAARKKKRDCSAAKLLTLEEGMCVQMMHLGAYDDEPATVAAMDAYLEENGYENDFSETRLHHEIYLSNPEKTPPEKRKTVIRHPIKKK